MLAATAALLLLFGPEFLNLYWLRILSNAFMFATLAQAINIIAGYTGYSAFGNVVFFGLGAYSTAIVMVRYQGSFFTGLIVGMLVCVVFVLVFGPPLLRLRGHYFAIATLGFNEATRAIVNNLTDFTGGGMGLSVPLPPGDPAANAAFFYYLLYGVMALSIVVTYLFSITRIGHECCAIRDDELKAEAMGLHTTRNKTVAWMISAALTSLVGGIYAYWFSYVEPPAVFDMTIAVKSFVIFLLGGAGTIFGPIVAAFFLEFLSTFVWSQMLAYHLGTMGIIIILIVLFLPNGFVAFLRERPSLEALFRDGRK
ncbi:MAG: branched-chain amino acid ABC transporter permease [Alphaproteobacteria bacterium]|nr:branched-chain amino acid ABC transporter permease [Alphaproteobacteria bacterium]